LLIIFGLQDFWVQHLQAYFHIVIFSHYMSIF